MQSLSEVDYLEFKNALDAASVRVSQIIFIGLGVETFIFILVIFVIFLKQHELTYNEEMIQTIDILSLLNFLFVISSIGIGKVLYDRQFSEQNLKRAVSKEFKDNEGKILDLSPPKKCIMIIRTASLVRLAIFEGAAFIGLAVTLQVVISGIGSFQQFYYLNALSILPLLGYIILNFPNAERIEEIFRTRIQK